MKEGFYEKIITETLTKALEKESDKTMLVESFNKSLLQIYPIVSDGIYTFQNDVIGENLWYKVFDIAGRKINSGMHTNETNPFFFSGFNERYEV
jgi:hypothetical protein